MTYPKVATSRDHGAAAPGAAFGVPASPRFPEVEDIGWQAIHNALCGRTSPAAAVADIQRHAERILADTPG